MDILYDFNKLTLKPIVFEFNHFNSYWNLSINIPKIVKINQINTNDYFNNLYSKIPHHSQR